VGEHLMSICLIEKGSSEDGDTTDDAEQVKDEEGGGASRTRWRSPEEQRT